MDISLIRVRVYASRRGAVNASGGRFIVSDSVRRHPNKFAMTERRLFVLLRVRCPGAIDLGLGGVPQNRLDSAGQWAAQILCNSSSLYPREVAGAGPLSGI